VGLRILHIRESPEGALDFCFSPNLEINVNGVDYPEAQFRSTLTRKQIELKSDALLNLWERFVDQYLEAGDVEGSEIKVMNFSRKFTTDLFHTRPLSQEFPVDVTVNICGPILTWLGDTGTQIIVAANNATLLIPLNLLVLEGEPIGSLRAIDFKVSIPGRRAGPAESVTHRAMVFYGDSKPSLGEASTEICVALEKNNFTLEAYGTFQKFEQEIGDSSSPTVDVVVVLAHGTEHQVRGKYSNAIKFNQEALVSAVELEQYGSSGKFRDAPVIFLLVCGAGDQGLDGSTCGLSTAFVASMGAGCVISCSSTLPLSVAKSVFNSWANEFSSPQTNVSVAQSLQYARATLKGTAKILSASLCSWFGSDVVKPSRLVTQSNPTRLTISDQNQIGQEMGISESMLLDV